MEKWIREQTLFTIISIVVLTIISVIFIYEVFKISKKKKDKYLNVIYPKNDEIQTKKQKKEKRKLRTRFSNYLIKKGIDKKIRDLYVRAGKYDKTGYDFIFDCIKYFILGVILLLALGFAIGNILIAFIVALFIMVYPPLALFSKIKSREASFRNDFPYFLQTVAFVLKNGTNFQQAFFEVTEKQEDTVLKEIMQDVIKVQNINAGDYVIAFQSMTEKMKIEEVSEFVNIVLDNLEKGVSVSETFLNQAQNTSKILNLSIKKKIKSVSTKILFPILVLGGAIALLFISL